MCLCHINLDMMLSIIMFFKTASFKSFFKSLSTSNKGVVEWIERAVEPTEKDIIDVLEEKRSYKKLALKMFQFLSSKGMVLCKLKTK